MVYQIFIHHSNNSAGFVLKSRELTILSGRICGDFKGYTEPMLLSLLRCFAVIPEGSCIEIYSPIILAIMTDCGTEKCTDLRRCVRRKIEKYSVSYHKASRNDNRIREVKQIIEHPDNPQNHKENNPEFNKEDFIPDYIAYTDGSCNNFSPYGEGGAAYIILDRHDNIIAQNSKGFIGTTNNRMEMLAIISVINWLPDDATVEIRTDSQYCINMLSHPKCPNKINKNRDLVEKFYRIRERKGKVYFTWVKGHNGTEYNELADALAESRTEEMRALHNISIYNYQNSPKCTVNRKVDRKRERV